MNKRTLAGATALGSLVLSLSAQSFAGKGTIDAASMKLTVHKFGVSTSADCKNPKIVFESASGVEEDLLSNPTFGSGPVDPGTYNCVLIEVSKIIKTSAKTSAGACTAGTEFSDVICGDGQKSVLADGTPVTCSGSATNPQHVTLFINTAAAGASGERALLPPTDASDTTSGLKLTSPLVVSTDTPVTLVVDPTAFLDGSSGSVCSTSAPSFSVR